MVYFSTSDEWQRQSSLLLQARPTTTRITTKYNIPNLESPKFQKVKKRKRDAEGDTAMPDSNAAPKVPKATLTLKAYCPESGVCLQFQTDKAAEVGRIVAGLGRLGRHMAALPEKAEGIAEDASAAKDVPQVQPEKDTSVPPQQQQQPSGSGGSGGGKKKKKGKK